LFLDAVRKNQKSESSSEADIEDSIKTWLKNAADRQGGRKIRKDKQVRQCSPSQKEQNKDIGNGK
jgi:hypothetical protein